jgi:hypothetical protein
MNLNLFKKKSTVKNSEPKIEKKEPPLSLLTKTIISSVSKGLNDWEYEGKYKYNSEEFLFRNKTEQDLCLTVNTRHKPCDTFPNHRWQLYKSPENSTERVTGGITHHFNTTELKKIGDLVDEHILKPIKLKEYQELESNLLSTLGKQPMIDVRRIYKNGELQITFNDEGKEYSMTYDGDEIEVTNMHLHKMAKGSGKQLWNSLIKDGWKPLEQDHQKKMKFKIYKNCTHSDIDNYENFLFWMDFDDPGNRIKKQFIG